MDASKVDAPKVDPQDPLCLLSSYRYVLPEEKIAKYPCYPRDHSRLMVLRRKEQTITHCRFYDLPSFLQSGDLLVFNNTKVVKARLFGKRATGGAVEFLLVRPLDDQLWEVLAKPGKKLPVGTEVFFQDALTARIEEVLPGGERIVGFNRSDLPLYLERYGHLPLPGYMERADEQEDQIAYQTVYAKEEGALAAPTAGLHFTQELLSALKKKGIDQVELTLHTGLGTFKPVKEENILNHPMHKERYLLSAQAAQELNTHPGRKVCVGTTSCRTVESAYGQYGCFQEGAYETALFIYPGYHFKCADVLLTNFHLPESTLLMLVCAFGGHDFMMHAYQVAIEEGYRFYSYGDAMLIL